MISKKIFKSVLCVRAIEAMLFPKKNHRLSLVYKQQYTSYNRHNSNQNLFYVAPLSLSLQNDNYVDNYSYNYLMNICHKRGQIDYTVNFNVIIINHE